MNFKEFWKNERRRKQVSFWYRTKRGKTRIQPSMGVDGQTREEIEREVRKYLERIGGELIMIESIF